MYFMRITLTFPVAKYKELLLRSSYQEFGPAGKQCETVSHIRLQQSAGVSHYYTSPIYQ